MFSKMLSLLARPFTLGSLLAIIFAVVSVKYYDRKDQFISDPLVRLFDSMANVTHNLRLRLRGPILRESPIAILAVDEDSLEKLGQWPWPRSILGQAVEALFAYQAKTLAFDAIFAEEDHKSAISSLQRVRQLAQISEDTHPDLDKILNQEIARENTDESFARVIARLSPKVIMGSYFEDSILEMSPYKDLCFSVLYEFSPEATYWNFQEIPVGSSDQNEVFLPHAWSEVLNQQIFPTLNQESLKSWRAQNPENDRKVRQIQNFLAQYEMDDENITEILIQFWVDRKDQELNSILQILAEGQAGEVFRRLQNGLNKVFDRHDLVTLRTQFHDRKNMYCGNAFWSENDPAQELFAGTLEDVYLQYPELAGQNLAQIQSHYNSLALINPIVRPRRWWINIPSLARGTTYTGFFNTKLDSDGAIRRTRLVVRSGEKYMPSIALLSYLVGNDYSARVLLQPDDLNYPPQHKYVGGLEVWNKEGEIVSTVPLNKEGDLLINYAGPDRFFPYLGVAELLSSDTQATIQESVWSEELEQWVLRNRRVDKMDFIKDRYFILGATAVGLYDLRITPFEENYPGVETHANVLDNLLRQDFLRYHPQEKNYMFFFLLLSGILFSFLVSYFNALYGLIATIASLTGIVLFDLYYIFPQGYVVASFIPFLSLSSIFFSLTSYKYFTEERQKKELKGTFQKYVSPSIVNEVLKDPSNLSLGGKKQHMTVFFSDVRGFTTISERLDPQALTQLLNNYLTPMTEIVFRNKGTLDKYMGDALMAFFGAPVAYPEHAECACRCALEQIAKTKELQKIYESQGLPQIDVGIGINTGDMNVGNMGSATVQSYTVMGDAVNLGSRLEGINKEYGTKIMISEFTHEALKGKFWTREMDRVRVKGKEKPVRIFELISEKAPDEDTQKMLEHFKKGYELYMKAQFEDAKSSFLEALKAKPEDFASDLYVKRCEDFLATPPPEGWDGVYVMTTK